MSGSTRVIEADPGGVLPRLVDATRTLDRVGAGPWALVGGLAVMLHLGSAHRVTADVDSVIDDTRGGLDDALAVLVADGHATWVGHHLRAANGTAIDLIPVSDYDPRDLPQDPLERAFAISHTWAMATARPCTITVIGPDGSRAAQSEVHLAERSGLVAMKLGAHLAARRSAEKHASDAYDAYRLLDAGGGSALDIVAEQLATAPLGLATWCTDTIAASFITRADHWARQIRVYSRGAGMDAVDADDLEVVGSLAAERIRRACAAAPAGAGLSSPG